MEFWAKAGGTARWREIHAGNDPVGVDDKLRQATYAGRPFGEAAFVERLGEKFGRQWRKPPVLAPDPDNRAIA
jgi:hypothetical protein